MNLTLKDIENVQKQIDELKAKLQEEDKLELPSTSYFVYGNPCIENGGTRNSKELAKIASSRMVSANKLEAYASVLEPDYRWVDGEKYYFVCKDSEIHYSDWSKDNYIGLPKMSKTTAEKLCELLNSGEVNL